MPITFKVSNKKPEPVDVQHYHHTRRDGEKSLIAETHYLNHLKEYEQEKCGRILQESEWDTGNSIYCNSGFVLAISSAYNQHHNLVLKPDDVWIAITTQFSLYVNGNAEKLRSMFVEHEGKKTLTVYQDSTLNTADYANLAEQTVSALKDNIKIPEMARLDFTEIYNYNSY